MNSKTHKIENKKEILLLDGKKIIIELPWNDKWMDYQDDGSAEVYQNYKYLSNDGEVLADIFWSLAPELDCELSRENIFTSWQDNYGKAICFECKPMIDSVYTMRAEMKTVDLYKVSYYVQTAEDLLLECGLQVHTKNMSDKQTEQFVKLFEKLIKNSKFK